MNDWETLAAAVREKRLAFDTAKARLQNAKDLLRSAEQDVEVADQEYRDAKGDLWEKAMEPR